MKTTTLIAVAVALAAASASMASTKLVHITIRHQVAHCHSWSADGGAWKASQTVRLARGGSIVFRNNDLMPHRLAQTGGPSLTLPRTANMNHLSASFTLTFAKAGTYRFKTIPGEDYTKGVKTTGEDNNLTLTVVVT